MEKLINKARKLYNTQEITYEWQEVESLITSDPILFEKCLRKAKNPKYINNDQEAKNKTLWIACNMVTSGYKATYCYLCGRNFSREDYLDGKSVHLEHFIPRSKGGLHHPINITLVCRDCNLTKSNLTDEDFRQILNNPESFFITYKIKSKLRQEKLKDFAEIYLPRIGGLQEYAERHGNLNSMVVRAHWENLREEYRQKWFKPN